VLIEFELASAPIEQTERRLRNSGTILTARSTIGCGHGWHSMVMRALTSAVTAASIHGGARW
jgi:hypothetical protein